MSSMIEGKGSNDMVSYKGGDLPMVENVPEWPGYKCRRKMGQR